MPEPAEGHASRVQVCTCDAGKRFWSLAVDQTELVVALMGLDASGRILGEDGLYGRFGANDRRLLRCLAAGQPASRLRAYA